VPFLAVHDLGSAYTKGLRQQNFPLAEGTLRTDVGTVEATEEEDESGQRQDTNIQLPHNAFVLRRRP